MRNWSIFTPNLNSWINAFLLAMLLIVATSIIPSIHYLFGILYIFIAWLFYFIAFLFSIIVGALPQFIQFIIGSAVNLFLSILNGIATLLSPLILLLPIPIIAFAHHYLYLLLNRYYPDLDSAERGRVTGYFPSIVSWWHGLFALLVIIMAMLFSDSLLSIVPWLNFNFSDYNFLPQVSNVEIYGNGRISMWVRMALMILGQPIYRPFMRLIIWIIAAAYIYQFEFSLRQHLIGISRDRTNSN